jgi:hypothetical protein
VDWEIDVWMGNNLFEASKFATTTPVPTRIIDRGTLKAQVLK